MALSVSDLLAVGLIRHHCAAAAGHPHRLHALYPTSNHATQAAEGRHLSARHNWDPHFASSGGGANRVFIDGITDQYCSIRAGDAELQRLRALDAFKPVEDLPAWVPVLLERVYATASMMTFEMTLSDLRSYLIARLRVTRKPLRGISASDAARTLWPAGRTGQSAKAECFTTLSRQYRSTIRIS